MSWTTSTLSLKNSGSMNHTPCAPPAHRECPLLKLHMTSSAPVRIGYMTSLTYDSLHTIVKEEKRISSLKFYQRTNLSWLINEYFSFISSSTFIPHTLKYFAEVTAGIWPTGGCLYFFPEQCRHKSCGFVQLLVLCDQFWLSHWTRLSVKPDLIVRFSLK